MSNSKKGNTSLTLAEEELLAVQKYPCLYDKSHRSHKKNVVQNGLEAVTD